MAEDREDDGTVETTRGASPERGARRELGDALGELMGRLLHRGRLEVERAARLGRERLTLRQLRIDRDRMYQKLGKEARHLLEGGELTHPGVRRGVERIKDLEARILEMEDQIRARGGQVDEVAPTEERADEG